MADTHTQKPSVLVVESVHEILHERLSTGGFECENKFDSDRAELLSSIHTYTGIVVRSRIAIDRELMDRATNLRFVARSGSGLETIDVNYARQKGIQVFSSPEGNQDAVGEHVIGMLLMLFNRLHLADREVREGLWRREANRGIELRGQTVGIIGFGHMGRAVAKKLMGFDCRIIAYDKYLTAIDQPGVEQVTLDELFREAQVVSLHLPLSEETSHFADHAFFHSFTHPIWFVNTARGQHTHTPALVDALQSGKVRGACLDVLEYEKASLEGLDLRTYPEDLKYLATAENVILTPHVAGWTTESYYKLSDVLADKILRWWSQATVG